MATDGTAVFELRRQVETLERDNVALRRQLVAADVRLRALATARDAAIRAASIVALPSRRQRDDSRRID